VVERNLGDGFGRARGWTRQVEVELGAEVDAERVGLEVLAVAVFCCAGWRW